MGFLYVDSTGKPKTRHSYSAGMEFDACPLKFYLHRIVGWREKDTKAALLFGRALESAVQFMHESNGSGGEDEFVRLWEPHRDNDKLVYTKVEQSWESLLRCGIEMMRLYEIRLPSLPIPMDTRFQREFLKEVFPGDARLCGIEMFGKLDMICYTDPKHKLLPRIPWTPEMGLYRPLIVDMKTSGVDFDESYPGIVAQDIQLRTYSWMTGIQDVALLWFKKNHHELKKGTSVTLLKDVGSMKAGSDAVVAFVDDDFVYIVKNDDEIDLMDAAQGRKADGSLNTTKAAVERKRVWIDANTLTVSRGVLTRQRLQFCAGRVDPESAAGAGRIAGDQIKGIVSAWEENQWPNTFGIRYPHDDRRDLFFRAFVMKDKKLRDEVFEKNELVDDLDDVNDVAEPEAV